MNWNEENTARLVELAGNKEAEISQDSLETIANELGTSSRSIGSKLRRMDYTVAKATGKKSEWTEAQVAELTTLITSNSGNLTYNEIADTFEGGAFTSRQVQGKILSLELFEHIRKADPKVAAKVYTDEQEAEFVTLINNGASIEDLADAFDKPVASVRGKALSLLRAEKITEMPVQNSSAAKEQHDVFDGVDVAALTVAELAEKAEKTERGIRSILSRRGIKCADYDGEAKRAKLDKAAKA